MSDANLRRLCSTWAVAAALAAAPRPAAADGPVEDTLLVEVYDGGDSHHLVGVLRDGAELELHSLATIHRPDPWNHAWEWNAFGWENGQQATLRAKLASSIDALNQQSLHALYLSWSCELGSAASAPVSAELRPLPIARFYVSPNERMAIYQPKDAGGSFVEGGILVDLESKRAERLACDFRPVTPRWSPEGKWVAYGLNKDRSKTDWVRDPDGSWKEVDLPNYSADETLSLFDADTRELAWRVPLEDKVVGVAWARNSNTIAVLETSSYMGFWPWELLFASAGHPVPHDSFRLEWFDRSGARKGRATVLRNITYGLARIDWTPESLDAVEAAAGGK